VEPPVLSVGSIAGGNRYNIIADSVKLEGTARTLRKEGPEFIKSRMDAMLKGITSAFNTTYTLDYRQNAPVTFNDPALTTAIRPALASIVGEKNVVLPPPQMGAEDFGFYQQKVPGVFFFLGVGNEAKKTTAMIHTEYFDLDEDTLPIGARAMSVSVLDYLYRSDTSSR
jgi:metal-dependent amidase/aminoacylase/carboxypeptidase family protein